MSAMMPVQGTRAADNYLKDKDRETLKRDIVILDIHNNIASVKAHMEDWTDYMHLVKVDGNGK